jgi:tight adherence protein B
MNPLVLLAGVGVMVALAGLVLAAAGVAGVGPSRPARTGRRFVVRRSWLAAAAVGLLVLVATGWVAVAAGAAGACVIVPAILASGAEADTRIARLEGLAGFTRRLADLLASGAVGSLDHALHRAATGCPPAIKPEVAALVSRMGPQGLEPALRAFGRDLADPAGDHVAMALILRARNGGRGLATVLQNLAGDVDGQVRMRRQIKAERAKPMNSFLCRRATLVRRLEGSGHRDQGSDLLENLARQDQGTSRCGSTARGLSAHRQRARVDHFGRVLGQLDLGI